MLCRPGAHIRDFHAHNPTSERGNNKNISIEPLQAVFVLKNAEHATYFSQKEAQYKDSFTKGQELEMSKFSVCVHWGA